MSDIIYAYPMSKQMVGETDVCVALWNGKKSLIAKGSGELYNNLEGAETALDTETAKVCPLNHANAAAIRTFIPFTRPSNHKGHNMTIGLGDRLGVASAGHLRLIRGRDEIFPVLAQQSKREVTLTDRSFADVLDCASWAVLQENYQNGWGADGDHLKSTDDIKEVLDLGYTMITLDCSDYIGTDPEKLSSGEAYLKALDFTEDVYKNILTKCGRDIDFELSIDETECTTSPEAHLFVAKELKKRGISVTSMAPRFCGEFQKGIDYIGDVKRFEQEFAEHVRIAEQFGYKISVHSSSDKFTIYPIVGRESGGAYHLKVAGTNWLVALELIAEKEPALFREIFAYSLDYLPEAKKFYHITENTANIPEISSLSDAELPVLVSQSDARRVLHVCYGGILSDKKDGAYIFRNRIYDMLAANENGYYEALGKHIGKHLNLLGL